MHMSAAHKFQQIPRLSDRNAGSTSGSYAFFSSGTDADSALDLPSRSKGSSGKQKMTALSCDWLSH